MRIPNLRAIHTAIEDSDPVFEAVLRDTAAPATDATAANPAVVDKRTAEVDAVSRHSRLVWQAARRRSRYRVESSLAQATTLRDEARVREQALVNELDAVPRGSLIGGVVLIAASAVLLAVEYFLVVSVVPPALGLRPGSLPAIAMGAVAPLAMVALEPFVDRLIVAPFTHRRTLGPLARAAFTLVMLAVCIYLAYIAIRVVTMNAELRQEYAQILIDLARHRQGTELSPATVRNAVLAIGLLALIAAPFLCSFGHHSLTAGFRRWKLGRERRDLKQLALAAELRLADGRSHAALLAEAETASGDGESLEAVVRARALRALAERATARETRLAAASPASAARSDTASAADPPPAAPVIEISRPAPTTDRQLYEQILRRRRETLDAGLRKAS